ncbi:hypothetical protein CGRA01v4_01037 [Colletotrichum graminicola]|uniref:Uncharacterized protein n=1 Tax=Colletotrichum graminicola (strain M1.001 / M2 / FGSC 10212) TaxID=645133 RepID=E3QGT0_COLGM|nr:uncharacterized protein GLRG_05212 [Colletotrichum graminicola M1.001]EFQ30068.1 hypothetical protein GLRG_05212 [Colletotrichum graminicola M1.001]WDK09758.1 hypothetical protein CGRA01v4_01037 [Colletotrichum graminicola]
MNGNGTARPSPMLDFKATHPGIFTHGARGSPLAGTEHELHRSIVRDIIKKRRDQRRARLQQQQQRCRTHSNDTTPTKPTPPSRSVTPLRRQPSQSSSKPDSPRSCASSDFSSEYSSDFSPCVSPLMEDLMLEIKDAIQSSGTHPEHGASPKRSASAFDMGDIFELIEEAQREYESLSRESPAAQRRIEPPRQPRWSWESLLDHSTTEESHLALTR